MTSSRIYGDWRNTLPGYLRKQYPNPVTLTDDQLADITGSIDERESSPYFPIDAIRHGAYGNMPRKPDILSIINQQINEYRYSVQS